MLGAWVWGVVSLVAALAFLRAAVVAGRFRFLEDDPLAERDTVVPLFGTRDDDAPEGEAPTVSALVAARDEGAAVTHGLGTLLEQEGVRMQVVAVDDRSSDDTGARLRALAAAHDEVVVKTVEVLPEGWLGKVHALSVARPAATGHWLLFSDADVELGPRAVRRAVHLAEREGLDHVAVVPAYRSSSVALRVLVAAASNLLLAGTRAHEVGVPGKTAFLGLGAFNLVRAARWDAGEGLEWLKLEVLDDMGVALAVQRAGGRAAVRLSREEVRVRWYPSVRAMARGVGKVLWANAGYSALRLMVQAILLAGLAVGPLLALAQPALGTRVLGGVALAALGGLAVRRAQLGLQPAWVTLAGPLGQVGLALCMLRAWLAHGFTRRLVWRDTAYRFSLLRAGQRVWRRRGARPWP